MKPFWRRHGAPRRWGIGFGRWFFGLVEFPTDPTPQKDRADG